MKTAPGLTQRFTRPAVSAGELSRPAVVFEARDATDPTNSRDLTKLLMDRRLSAAFTREIIQQRERRMERQALFGHRYTILSLVANDGRAEDVGAIHTVAYNRWTSANYAARTGVASRLTVVEANIRKKVAGGNLMPRLHGDIAATMLFAAVHGQRAEARLDDPDGVVTSPLEGLVEPTKAYVDDFTVGSLRTALLQERRWLENPVVRMTNPDPVPEPRQSFAEAFTTAYSAAGLDWRDLSPAATDSSVIQH